MAVVARLREDRFNASSVDAFNRCDRLLKQHCKAWQVSLFNTLSLSFSLFALN